MRVTISFAQLEMKLFSSWRVHTVVTVGLLALALFLVFLISFSVMLAGFLHTCTRPHLDEINIPGLNIGRVLLETDEAEADTYIPQFEETLFFFFHVEMLDWICERAHTDTHVPIV